MHGGAPGSGAPHGNKNALRHGLYTREALAQRRKLRELMRQSREVIAKIGEHGVGRDNRCCVGELDTGRILICHVDRWCCRSWLTLGSFGFAAAIIKTWSLADTNRRFIRRTAGPPRAGWSVYFRFPG